MRIRRFAQSAVRKPVCFNAVVVALEDIDNTNRLQHSLKCQMMV